MHYTQEEVPPGYEEFVRENAVVLVAERDRLIARLRAEITRLLTSQRGLRHENDRLRKRLGLTP